MKRLIHAPPEKDEVLGEVSGACYPELPRLGLPVLGGTAGGSPPPLVALFLPLLRDSLNLSLNKTSGGGGGSSTSPSS